MTKSVKITKTIKIPAFLPLKYSKSPVYLMYQQASMQCIGDGVLYIMFYYRYFCFQCFFRAEKALYMGKPDFFGNCFAFFCSGGSDCRLCASPKGTFCFIVYFANIYSDILELTEKVFFRPLRNTGFCFIFMFACFISRLALIVLRTICAYFLILQNSYFGFRFPFRCHRELGFLFDFKSRFYIFPLAYQ